MEDARFEIYPEHQGPGAGSGQPTGRYRWRFRDAAGVITVESSLSFISSEIANYSIHNFINAIDEADCGIHPDIIDVDK